mgnify:CR=1 FL=1
MQREDDFATRRQHLASLSDAELKARFWQLAEVIVQPLVELAEKNTSPSVERSVLLRLGFDSLEAKALVQMTSDQGLLSKGAGHVVYVAARNWGCDGLTAGRRLLEGQGWDTVQAYFQRKGADSSAAK